MKKILVLLLIFGMASLAQAQFVPVTLTMSAPAEVDLNLDPTGLVTVTTTLGIAGTEQAAALTDALIDISGTAPYTEGTITPNANFDGVNVLNFSGMDLNASAPPPYVSNGGTLFTFTVNATAVGTLDFDLTDEDGSNWIMVGTDLGNFSYLLYGPLTVVGASTTVVPEPMTILLLGLGGLFLRRRK